MRRKARARMLAPSISVSERVNSLSLKATLLYTWMLAHADDQGRLSANPAYIKALVVPLRRDIVEADVERLLAEMSMACLIEIYAPSEELDNYTIEDAILQIRDWWDFQALRNPQPSRYRPPPDWEDKVATQSRDERGRYNNSD